MIYLFREILSLLFSRKTRHLLVVFQNNNELRGGGGFITQLLDVALGGGKVRLNFRHDYNDLRGNVRITPPDMVKKYLRLNHWFFRDSNIFGDFGKNAERMRDTYRTIFPQNKVAAVFAVNFSCLEKIVSILKSLKVDGRAFTEDNLFTELSASVSDIDRHNLKALNGRKSVLRNLFMALVKAVLCRFWNWPGLVRCFRECVAAKEIQIHFFDKKIQQELARKNFAFDFSARGARDCLAVVENNFLGLKSNRYLRRAVYHDVKFSLDASGHAKDAASRKCLADVFVTVRVRTEHFGSFNYPLSGTYQSYTKVYFPKNARDVQILTRDAPAQAATPATEGEFQTLDFHNILKVGGAHEIAFRYRLPAEQFSDNKYSFQYLKQSGAENEHVFETVSFPDQYAVELSGAEGVVRENMVFLGHRRQDCDFRYEVRGALHFQSPRIFFHEIVQPNLIHVRFNEPVQFTGQSKLPSVKVLDAQNGTEIAVKNIEFANDDRHLLLQLHDLPQEEGKYYRVVLTGIMNRAGVPLQPQPRQLTVVYRSKYFNQEGDSPRT